MADGSTLRPGYEVYYDHQFRVWVAYRVDTGNNQLGPCGYGMTKVAARADCDYQNEISDHAYYRGRGVREARDVEQSEAFRRWFAGSKVVDADGNPLVVYHGTNQAFSGFDRSKLGNMTRAVSASEFFFTDNPAEASDYADAAAQRVIFNQDAHDREVARLRALAAAAERRRDFDEYERISSEADDLEIQAVRAEPQGANVMPCYLRIVNPLDTQHDGAGINTGEVRDLIQQAHAEGHDGLIMRNVRDSPTDATTGTHYAVFSADQIKSATGNSGAFDPGSHDIGEASLVAFSPAHTPVNNPSNDMVDMMNATSSELPNIHSGGPDGVIGEGGLRRLAYPKVGDAVSVQANSMSQDRAGGVVVSIVPGGAEVQFDDGRVEKVNSMHLFAPDGDDGLCAEATPPGMEQWVKDRKAGFKKQYGKDWEERLYATAWSEYDKKHHKGEAIDVGPYSSGVERGSHASHSINWSGKLNRLRKQWLQAHPGVTAIPREMDNLEALEFWAQGRRKGEAKRASDGMELGRLMATVRDPKADDTFAKIYNNREFSEYVVLYYRDGKEQIRADEHFDYNAHDRGSVREAYADAHAAAMRFCGITTENQGDVLVGPPPIQHDGTDRRLQDADNGYVSQLSHGEAADGTPPRRNWQQFLNRSEFDRRVHEVWPEATTDADEWSQQLATWNMPDGFVVGWWDNRVGQGEVRPIGEAKVEGLGDADSPEAFITALRAEAQDAHDAAAHIASAWQDENAGRFWTEAGRGLDTLADRLEQWVTKNLYGKTR